MRTLDQNRIEKLAEQYSGRVTAASEDGQTCRVEFPVSTRAAGFYDEIVSILLTDEGVAFDDPAKCVVVVTLPKGDA